MAEPEGAPPGWESMLRLAGAAVGQLEAVAELAVPPAQRLVVRRVLGLSLLGKLEFGRRLIEDRRVGDPARFLVFLTGAYTVLPLRFGPKRLGRLRRLEKLILLPLLLLAILRLTPAGVLTDALPAEEGDDPAP